MYNRRVLIFSRQDQRYSSCGSLCGMAKLTVTNGQMEVCVFVPNLVFDATDEWWGVVLIEGNAYKSKLPHVNNHVFTLPTTHLDNVAFLLVKQESTPTVVAESYLGNKKINAVSSNLLTGLLCNQATPYESFVDGTANFYPKDTGVDVKKLKEQGAQKYVALQNYSSAFERYYATGRGDNYLQAVQEELEQLFSKFPPYYPLINKYEQSYFVRIDFPSGDKFFVVGLLASNNQAKYICYALPAQDDAFCDKDFTLVEKDGQGFWMLFQDAENGQITTLQQS